MSHASSGYMYQRLATAVSDRGSARTVYTPDSTLSRRGLLTRTDRRARELGRLGVEAGDLVALSLGNAAELLVMLLACSQLGAVAVPVDPALGERIVRQTARRMPLRAVIRRPRGPQAARPNYGPGYAFSARRRLTGSRLVVDILCAPRSLRDAWAPPPGAELISEARGIGGIVRDVIRTGPQLRIAGEAAASALALHPENRLLCTQPLIIPRFFEPVLLGWLASDAQLIMAEGAAIDAIGPTTQPYENLVVVDSWRQILELARTLSARASPLDLQPVVPMETVPPRPPAVVQRALTRPLRQLLFLEELGLIAHRVFTRDSVFEPAGRARLCPGAPMQSGGHELLFEPAAPPWCRPTIPPTQPGSTAQAPWHHTGYAGRFNTKDQLVEVLGRDDGLITLEGRRACLEQVECALLAHRRLTWVQASIRSDANGDVWIEANYRATGESAVDDLEDHAIGTLPSFVVPRRLIRNAP